VKNNDKNFGYFDHLHRIHIHKIPNPEFLKLFFTV